MQCTFCVIKYNEPPESGSALFALVSHVVATYYQAGASVYVACDTTVQTEAIDELLWQCPADRFVPHNLQGEGPAQGAPVEIGQKAPTRKRQVLVNLQANMPEFSNRFNQVIDFVPRDEAEKTLARQRFMQYRQVGFALHTIDITTLSDFKV